METPLFTDRRPVVANFLILCHRENIENPVVFRDELSASKSFTGAKDCLLLKSEGGSTNTPVDSHLCERLQIRAFELPK